MPDPKKFTVMELADAVGVPRTTINDWLGKYAMYIDSAMQGRRRIYSDASLAVLKTIAALRDKGLSSIEIERELAGTCPVHPQLEPEKSIPEPPREPAKKNTPAPAPESSEAVTLQPDEKPAEKPENNGAAELVLRRNSEEVIRRFQEMMDKIDRLEATAGKPASNKLATVLLVLTLILVVAGFGGGAWFALKHLEDMKDRAAKLKNQIETGEKANLALRENVLTLTGKVESGEKVNRALRDNVISLDRGSREYQKNLDRLTRELEEEKLRAKKQAETEAALHRSEAARKELELERQKQENARLRLDFMRRLEEENAKAAKAIEAAKKTPQKSPAPPATTAAIPAVKPEPKSIAPASNKNPAPAVSPAATLAVKPEPKSIAPASDKNPASAAVSAPAAKTAN